MSKRLSALALLFTTGCASLDFSEYTQPVMVLSDPPGAQVYQGDKYLGVTPSYVRVRRKRHPQLRFVDPATRESRAVRMSTRYRWMDTFFGNFLMLSLAPIGWGLDFATGTAWTIKDPGLQRFGRASKWPVTREPSIVAIAPPEGDDLDVSDGLGLAVDTKLKAMKQYRVLNYLGTAPLFQYYGATDEPPVEREDRYRLYHELRADHVLYSKTERRGNSYRVTAELKDTITTHTAAKYTWDISPSAANLKSEISRRTFYDNYLMRLVPNTAFLNFSSYTPNITVGPTEYQGKEGETHGSFEKALKYLSAISIASHQRPRPNVRGQWTLDFVPAAVLSKKSIVFTNYAPTAGIEFERWYLSAGYGLEGGYLWRYGFVYLDIIPTYTWSQVSFDTNALRGTVARSSIQSIIELGYTYFVTDHIVTKLYIRNLAEDDQIWNKVLTGISGQPTRVAAMNSGFVGIAIGYHLPSSLKDRKGWAVQEAR